MSEPQRNHDSHNIPEESFGKKVTTTSKNASTEPPHPKNNTRSRELAELRNGTSKPSTIKAAHMRIDEISNHTDELYTLTDELYTLTSELSSLTNELYTLTSELPSRTGKSRTRTDELSSRTGELSSHTGELHAHTADELYSRSAELYSRSAELYSRMDGLKEKNLAFHKKIKTTGALSGDSASNPVDPMEAMEQDASHTDEFKINVRLLKFFAEEANEELEKWKVDELGDDGFFNDTNWPSE